MAGIWKKASLAVAALLLAGCGGLRYSELSPEAAAFHPRSVALLPVAAQAFPEARRFVEGLIVEALEATGWFAAVTGGPKMEELLRREPRLRQGVTDYLVKLDKVNYSDPALSSAIGSATEAEALLLARVDYWNYTTENDKKVGKVALSITMVEAKSGKIVWRAAHQRASDYILIKPDLVDLGAALIREMVRYMPH